MPFFSTQPSNSLSTSIRNAIASTVNGGLNPLQMIQAEDSLSQGQYHSALAQKAQQEAEQARQAGTLRESPEFQNQFAARAAGMTPDIGDRFNKFMTGAQVPNIVPNDDEGNPLPAAFYAKPEGVTDAQSNLYNAARQALDAARLAPSKVTGDGLIKDIGSGFSTALARGVQDLVAKGDYQGASVANQASKPGQEIKVWQNGTGPGTTFNPVTGDVKGTPPYQHVQNPITGATQAFNPQTGEVKDAANGTAGAPGSPEALTGDAFLSTLPKSQADTVKAMVEGRLAFPSGMALKTPYWNQMLQAAAQYEPGFDSTIWNARQSTRKDFLGGGKSAINLTAINTAIGHLDSFDKAAQALNNSDYPTFNKLWNAIVPEIGGTKTAANIRTFQQAKEAVSNELMRVFRGTGASSSDTAKWAETLNASDSPEALHAAVRGAVDLLDSRIGSLNEQYTRGMGQQAGDVIDMVYPKARALLDRLRSGQPATGPTSSGKINQAATTGAPAKGPQEGSTSTSKSGRPIIFKGGSWVYADGGQT